MASMTFRNLDGSLKLRLRVPLRAQEREPPREYLDRENHYVWGRRYLLHVIEVDEAPSVELEHRKMVLRLLPVPMTRKSRPSSRTGTDRTSKRPPAH